MIELSKCPNCAPEDRVTIAGKEFCMRCGTPAEDNAKIEDETSQAQASSVTKFSSNPPADQITANGNDTPRIEHISNSVPAGNPVAAPAQEANPPFATTNASIDKSAIDAQINSLSIPHVSPTSEQPKRPVREFVPPPAPIRKAPPVVNATSSAASTTPALPQDAALATPQAIATPDQPRANVKLVHDNMTLDKSVGVLSDDQFDQLQNSVSSPTDLSKPIDTASHVEDPIQPAVQIAMQPVSASLKPQIDTDPYKTSGQYNSNNQTIASTPPVTNKPKMATEPGKKKKSLKPAGIVVSTIALFLVGAYIWKLNYSNLAFKVASAKAGMTAAMPGYVPAGFNLSGDIRTNPGTVSYNLVNKSSDKNITISQAKTDWDSQALAENYVAPKSENYLALQAQGLTVYVFGNNQQASWVNKGTWYRLESSDKALTQDQIIKIATSL